MTDAMGGVVVQSDTRLFMKSATATCPSAGLYATESGELNCPDPEPNDPKLRFAVAVDPTRFTASTRLLPESAIRRICPPLGPITVSSAGNFVCSEPVPAVVRVAMYEPLVVYSSTLLLPLSATRT